MKYLKIKNLTGFIVYNQHLEEKEVTLILPTENGNPSSKQRRAVVEFLFELKTDKYQVSLIEDKKDRVYFGVMLDQECLVLSATKSSKEVGGIDDLQGLWQLIQNNSQAGLLMTKEELNTFFTSN